MRRIIGGRRIINGGNKILSKPERMGWFQRGK